MRTLHIGTHWFPEWSGGLARYYYELSRYLPSAGVEFRGLVAGSESVVAKSNGLVASFAPPRAPVVTRLWRARRAVAQALRDDPGVLVVSHFALYTVSSVDLLRGRPMVVHFQGPWALESGVEGASSLAVRSKRLVERRVYQAGTVFVTLSRAFARVLAEQYRVPPERIRTVPGGADVEHFAAKETRAEARARLGWPADRPIVLAVRRLVRRMGLEDLVEATREIRRRVPDAHVVIAGRGALEGVLRSRIEAAGLSSHVQLAGYVPDDALPLAYRAADLTVVPTVALEGFGLIAAESLAAGTPVIVTPVGGLPEVIEDLSPQLILPSAGAGPLAEVIAGALTGKIPVPTAGECQAFARAKYAWPVVVSRLRDVYACASGTH